MDSWFIPVHDNILARDSADPNNGNKGLFKNAMFSFGAYTVLLESSLRGDYGLVPVTIVGVHLGWETVQNLRAWWKGELSGKRCLKNLLDDLAAVVGGFGGAAVGATFGSIFDSPGWVIVGIFGSVAGSFTMASRFKRLTETKFHVPRSVALENAYNYFGLTVSCSNGQIKSTHHRLALEKHPDKGGSKEEFFELQVNLSIIKHHREEF